jgi:agmatinase
MPLSPEQLDDLRSKYSGSAADMHDPRFQKVAQSIFSEGGTRAAPYSGIPTLLAAPAFAVDSKAPDFGNLQVALMGAPMDLGASNRPGARFGPRALRAIERIGPYNHVLDVAPVHALRVADVGDVPFRSRYSLPLCIEDLEHWYQHVAAQGVLPLTVGGDHSITYPIMKALGAKQPLGMVHIDAHCDTGGEFDQTRFHHGGPFRLAVLDGVLDPTRCIQIGIRGSSEYLWEFSKDAGMTVIHAEEVTTMGIPEIVRLARAVVGDGPTYLSFDVDGLDPVYAPGTGTPEIGGLSTREALAIFHGLKGLNICGGDVVEVAPQYDPSTNTAQAGAQMLFEILSLMAFSPALKP